MSPDLQPEDLEKLSLWQAVPDGLVLVDPSGTILAVNDRLASLVDRPAADLVGAAVSELVPEADRPAHAGHVTSFFVAPSSRSMAAGGGLAAQRNDGTTVPVAISLSPVMVAGEPAVLAAVRDIADAVKADQQLAEATRRRMLVELRERIARDLHDTVVQELFATGMALQAVLGSIDDEMAAEQVSGAVDRIDSVIRHIREAVLGGPHRRDLSGLSNRLVAVAADLTPALGFPPRLVIDPELDRAVPAGVADHAVPVLREALANVARHAHAVDVDVEVRIENGQLVVRVTDDGVGPPARVVRPGGLANLAARAQEVGGAFELVAQRPSGTRMEWRAPLGGDSGGADPHHN